uniref:Uncharacterized protein n=1 Tax=Eutreptiella gymnastica TaxID=73025 RepID=A0A7S1NA78_9EUGL
MPDKIADERRLRRLRPHCRTPAGAIPSTPLALIPPGLPSVWQGCTFITFYILPCPMANGRGQGPRRWLNRAGFRPGAGANGRSWRGCQQGNGGAHSCRSIAGGVQHPSRCTGVAGKSGKMGGTQARELVRLVYDNSVQVGCWKL